MAQVIVYTGSDGNCHVCVPSGEIPIEEVLAKDCPVGAIIVDESILPQGADAQFFNSWKFNGSTVILDFSLAQASYLSQYNQGAIAVAQKRQLNTLIGILNVPDDATWSAEITAGRNAINVATTCAELLVVPLPTP